MYVRQTKKYVTKIIDLLFDLLQLTILALFLHLFFFTIAYVDRMKTDSWEMTLKFEYYIDFAILYYYKPGVVQSCDCSPCAQLY